MCVGEHVLPKFLCLREDLDSGIWGVAGSCGGTWWVFLLRRPAGPCCLLAGAGTGQTQHPSVGSWRRDTDSRVWIRPPQGRRFALFDSALKRTPCSYYSPNYWQGFVLGAGGITCLNPFEKSI